MQLTWKTTVRTGRRRPVASAPCKCDFPSVSYGSYLPGANALPKSERMIGEGLFHPCRHVPAVPERGVLQKQSTPGVDLMLRNHNF